MKEVKELLKLAKSLVAERKLMLKDIEDDDAHWDLVVAVDKFIPGRYPDKRILSIILNEIKVKVAKSDGAKEKWGEETEFQDVAFGGDYADVTAAESTTIWFEFVLDAKDYLNHPVAEVARKFPQLDKRGIETWFKDGGLQFVIDEHTIEDFLNKNKRVLLKEIGDMNDDWDISVFAHEDSYNDLTSNNVSTVATKPDLEIEVEEVSDGKVRVKLIFYAEIKDVIGS